MRFAYFGVYHPERFGEYVAWLAGCSARRSDRGAGADRIGSIRIFRAELSGRGLCFGLRHDRL